MCFDVQHVNFFIAIAMNFIDFISILIINFLKFVIRIRKKTHIIAIVKLLKEYAHVKNIRIGTSNPTHINSQIANGFASSCLHFVLKHKVLDLLWYSSNSGLCIPLPGYFAILLRLRSIDCTDLNSK